MSSVFNPRTDYSQDWKHSDFIESVTWRRSEEEFKVTGLKAAFDNGVISDLISVGGALAITSEQSAIVVWQPKAVDGGDMPQVFAPREGDFIQREEFSNEGWVIKTVNPTRFGEWILGCEREVTNG